LFQHQTIAELAAVISPSDAASPAEEAAGPLPLTPSQRWLFEQQLREPQHFNQSLLLAVPSILDATTLAQAAQHVVAHHDTLRLRFELTADGWQQRIADAEEQPIFSAIDVTNISADEVQQQIREHTAALESSLDLVNGPLLRLVLFYAGPTQPAQLLVTIHQLAVDARSWQLILADLWTAYQQLNQGAVVALPARTASFRQWAERQAAQADAQTTLDEQSYWQTILEEWIAPLPRDIESPESANTAASAATIRTTLDAEATRALFEVVPDMYRAEPLDLLLSALAQQLAAWSRERSLLLELQQDARQLPDEKLDLSRTAGWFAYSFPLLLSADPAAKLVETLRVVKDTLRQVPSRGARYGLLRYLNPQAGDQLSSLPDPEIRLSYWGQIGARVPDGAGWRINSVNTSPQPAPSAQRAYLLEIDVFVEDDALVLEWRYSTALHQHATIERLAHLVLDGLGILIKGDASADGEVYTPSDFPLSGLNQEDLSRFLSSVRRRS
ncbi:MAG TPA: condensation domain-containing protein, partial [Herpetosiphonaceae bacterium]